MRGWITGRIAPGEFLLGLVVFTLPIVLAVSLTSDVGPGAVIVSCALGIVLVTLGIAVVKALLLVATSCWRLPVSGPSRSCAAPAALPRRC